MDDADLFGIICFVIAIPLSVWLWTKAEPSGAWAAIPLAFFIAIIPAGLIMWGLSLREHSQPRPSPVEQARVEKEDYQRAAVVGGAVVAWSGYQAWRASRREKAERRAQQTP